MEAVGQGANMADDDGAQRVAATRDWLRLVAGHHAANLTRRQAEVLVLEALGPSPRSLSDWVWGSEPSNTTRARPTGALYRLALTQRAPTASSGRIAICTAASQESGRRWWARLRLALFRRFSDAPGTGRPLPHALIMGP